jgi:GntR family transcriptional regulator
MLRDMLDGRALDRTSLVPLYYQLQEILKEQIESGEWLPGDTLPPELKLASMFGVSRICVRQALQILEDDREIVRRQGSGTFVAPRKVVHRPTGISGLRRARDGARLAVRVLDTKVGVAERAILASLAAPAGDVGRLTALWLRDGAPFAIGQHFFRNGAPTLALGAGRREIRAADVEDRDVEVALTVETTQCGQFEADLLGIPNRSMFLLTFASVHEANQTGAPPVEVFRLGFRGDTVQLSLRT